MNNMRNTLSYKAAMLGTYSFLIGIALSIGSMFLKILYSIFYGSPIPISLHEILDYTFWFGMLSGFTAVIFFIIMALLKEYDM